METTDLIKIPSPRYHVLFENGELHPVLEEVKGNLITLTLCDQRVTVLNDPHEIHWAVRGLMDRVQGAAWKIDLVNLDRDLGTLQGLANSLRPSGQTKAWDGRSISGWFEAFLENRSSHDLVSLARSYAMAVLPTGSKDLKRVVTLAGDNLENLMDSQIRGFLSALQIEAIQRNGPATKAMSCVLEAELHRRVLDTRALRLCVERCRTEAVKAHALEEDLLRIKPQGLTSEALNMAAFDLDRRIMNEFKK
jgi:hypothetical protein